MEDERFILTRQGYDRLHAELEQLEAEQQERRGQLEDIYRDVDRSNDEEAADFDVRTMKEYVDERIGHLQYVLERAEVNDEDPNPRQIDPGERVTVWDLEAHQERTFNLVSGEEVGIVDDAVSVNSPVGQALVGRRVGDTIAVSVPDGWARYAIRRVEHIGAE